MYPIPNPHPKRVSMPLDEPGTCSHRRVCPSRCRYSHLPLASSLVQQVRVKFDTFELLICSKIFCRCVVPTKVGAGTYADVQGRNAAARDGKEQAPVQSDHAQAAEVGETWFMCPFVWLLARVIYANGCEQSLSRSREIH